MAPAPIKVGQVDDVQELRRAKPRVVPERFVRDEKERPALDNLCLPCLDEIPVIDLSKLLKLNSKEFRNEISKLGNSCRDWGFFQVINHGIDLELLEQIEKVGMEFFMLPLEEKLKYQMSAGTVQGYGQAFVFSEDQKLDWCNMFALGVHPNYIRNPKLWPSKPSDFSDAVGRYSSGVQKLCGKLLKYIALSLGLKMEVFEDMFGEAVQAIRMNYYPPCPRPDLVLGLSPHSDGSALTVLQQGKGSSVGLQILKDNNWVPVHPIPNSLVINIGDTIEVLTNGKYKSVEHRAVTHKERERLSIVTFYAPSYEVEIGPLQELVNENNPCKYRTFNHGDYSKHYVSSKLQGKKTLEFAKVVGPGSRTRAPFDTLTTLVEISKNRSTKLGIKRQEQVKEAQSEDNMMFAVIDQFDSGNKEPTGAIKDVMLESSTCGSLRVIKNRSIGQVNEAVEQLRSTRAVEVKAVDSGSQTHHGVMARPHYKSRRSWVGSCKP
ncbi:unnamed protein product [Rhodiola kirilowii]